MKYCILLFAIISQLAADWAPPPVIINPDLIPTQTSTPPQVAVHSSGYAVAVWVVTQDPSIQFSTFPHPTATGWSEPAIIDNVLGTSLPRIGMDDAGNATVVWVQSDGIQAATLPFGSDHWEQVGLTTMLTITLSTNTPQISVNSSGSAIAVWQITDTSVSPSVSNIQAATYNGVTWTKPAITDFISSGLTSGDTAANPQIALNATGDAIAVWQLYNGSTTVIQAATYDGTWTLSTPNLTTGNTATLPQVGIDGSANGVAVWQFNTGGNNIIQERTYSHGSGWNALSNLTTVGNATNPQVAVCSNGNAIAVWQLTNTFKTIEASTYTGGLWIMPVTLTSAGLTVSEIASNPQIAINNPGDAAVVWQLNAGALQIIESRFYKSGAWDPSIFFGNPINLTPDAIATLASTAPQVAINDSNFAVAVWALKDSTNGTIYVESETTAPISPSNFTGQRLKNNFFSQTDLIDVLSWSPSSDPTVVEYQISIGTALIATIPASNPLTTSIHNRAKNTTYTYTLVAVNRSGIASLPIFVTVP